MKDRPKPLVISGELLQAQYITEDEFPRDGCGWPESANTMTICVDAYLDGRIQGVLCDQFSNVDRPFIGLDQMLFSIIDVLDQIALPMSFEKIRTTFNPTIVPDSEQEPLHRAVCPPLRDKPIRRGKMASFSLRVFTRAHASIQGILVQNGTEKQIAFRSAMELMLLLKNEVATLPTGSRCGVRGKRPGAQ